MERAPQHCRREPSMPRVAAWGLPEALTAGCNRSRRQRAQRGDEAKGRSSDRSDSGEREDSVPEPTADAPVRLPKMGSPAARTALPPNA